MRRRGFFYNIFLIIFAVIKKVEMQNYYKSVALIQN